MENNDSPVVDYTMRKRKNIRSMIIIILLTYLLVSYILKFINDRKAREDAQRAEEEMRALITEKNSQISLVTDLEDVFLVATNEYIEFEHGIKIPMPNKFMDKENIISYNETVETNNIAYRSRAVKINYGPEENVAILILDIFRERLPEDYNYEQVLYYFEDGTKIYTREEVEGYFSYIIFKDTEVTYGVCYGKPELKIY